MSLPIHRRQIALVAIALVSTLAVLLAAAPVHAQSIGDSLWTASLGGTLEDNGFGLAVDGAGDVIVVGSFQGSADFDPGPGTRMLSSRGSTDAYVAKFTASGNLIWAVSLGGTHSTEARDVALDGRGDIYVIGSFSGDTDFDPGPGQNQLTSNGSTDIFLLRLGPNGNLVRAVALGSDESDDGEAVFVDGRGHIYITGSFEESMNVSSASIGGGTVLESEGEDDIFVIRYANDGALLRAWTIAGDDDATGHDIVVDGAGNVFVAGEFEGKIDFDPDLDDVRRSAGDEDIFVAKYNDAADQKWAAVFGGLEEDERPAISIDRAGNIYVTGTFESTGDFDPGPGAWFLTSIGQEDLFILRLNSAGALVWAHSIGGIGSDRGEGVTTGRSGDVLVTGSFEASVDFDPSGGFAFLSSAGERDGFVARYARDGFLYGARAMGGPLNDSGRAVAMGPTEGLYVAGSFQGSADFNVGAAAQVRTAAGGSDAFVTKRAYGWMPEGDLFLYLPQTNAAAPLFSTLRSADR